MFQPRHSSHRRAFTLVELLVVIGIIALLIGILLPTLSRARTTARNIVCQSNLRQQMQAITMYTNDNRGLMPYARNFGWEVRGADWSQPEGSKYAAAGYMQEPDLMQAYLGRSKQGEFADGTAVNWPETLKCPFAGAIGPAWIQQDPNATNYRYNVQAIIDDFNGTNGRPKPLPIARAENSSQALVQYDIIWADWFEGGREVNGEALKWNQTPAHFAQDPRVNAAYLDGHVGGFSFEELAERMPSHTLGFGAGDYDGPNGQYGRNMNPLYNLGWYGSKEVLIRYNREQGNTSVSDTFMPPLSQP